MHRLTVHALSRSLATLMLVVALMVQPVIAGVPGCGTVRCGSNDVESCCPAPEPVTPAESRSCCTRPEGCACCRPDQPPHECSLLCDCGDGQPMPAAPPAGSSPVESLRYFETVPTVDTLLATARPGITAAEQDGDASSSTFSCGVNVLHCVWQT
ncbi:hypothetical protein [Maioricimonas sp. JC845]|uniref:hypothetical protein n=1 Tax=Maioricimonas sp. JC845 TaxID=3232138 RepID=UPI003457FE6A